MTLSELGKYFERYIAVLANITVILGIPVFFYQQYQGQVGDSEKATLSYVERFQDRDFIKAQLDLFNEWRDFPVGAVHADLETLQDFVQKDMTARAARGDQSIDDALFRFDAIFSELAQCLDKKICSPDVSRAYFQDFAHRLICLYGRHYAVVEQSLGVTGFGAGIRQIAGDGGKCDG